MSLASPAVSSASEPPSNVEYIRFRRHGDHGVFRSSDNITSDHELLSVLVGEEDGQPGALDYVIFGGQAMPCAQLLLGGVYDMARVRGHV
jgi:hypothetical protein